MPLNHDPYDRPSQKWPPTDSGHPAAAVVPDNLRGVQDTARLYVWK